MVVINDASHLIGQNGVEVVGALDAHHQPGSADLRPPVHRRYGYRSPASTPSAAERGPLAAGHRRSVTRAPTPIPSTSPCHGTLARTGARSSWRGRQVERRGAMSVDPVGLQIPASPTWWRTGPSPPSPRSLRPGRGAGFDPGVGRWTLRPDQRRGLGTDAMLEAYAPWASARAPGGVVLRHHGHGVTTQPGDAGRGGHHAHVTRGGWGILRDRGGTGTTEEQHRLRLRRRGRSAWTDSTRPQQSPRHVHRGRRWVAGRYAPINGAATCPAPIRPGGIPTPVAAPANDALRLVAGPEPDLSATWPAVRHKSTAADRTADRGTGDPTRSPGPAGRLAIAGTAARPNDGARSDGTRYRGTRPGALPGRRQIAGWDPRRQPRTGADLEPASTAWSSTCTTPTT